MLILFRNNQQNKETRGVTLVEILVAVAIFSLIMLAVTSFQKDVWTYHTNLSNTLLGQQEAKQTIKTFVKEMRTASSGSNGAYTFSEAATSSVTFYSDINGDGLKDEVRYYLATTTLKKRVIVPTGNPLTYVLANATYSEAVHNITNSSTTPIFTYYPSTYAGTTSPLSSPVDLTAIRLVKITLIVEKDPNKSPVPMTLTSEVSVRNLKDNL